MRGSSATLLLPNEVDALNALCDMAHKDADGRNSKALTMPKGGKDEGGPPLRLQNLHLRARVSACRVLLEVASGTNYLDALEKHGMTHLEFQVMRHKDHDFALVCEAARRFRDENMVAKAERALERLATTEDCGLNVKAATFILERLASKRYARTDSVASGGGSGPKNVYNIVIQGFPQGQPCGNLATNPTSTPVIDA